MPEALQFISDSTPASLDSVDSLAAEGLGEDDDESDSEVDERLSTSPKHKHRLYPHWFQRTLDNDIAHIESARKGTSGHSQVYSAETFWVPHKSPFFHLQKSSLLPEDLFIPKFFLWDPDNLLPTGISCPTCSVKLNHGGIVRRPWQIIDIDHTYWIIGYTYECKGICQKKFQSWDARVLTQLPCTLAIHFPAHLTWRSGISLHALGVLQSCIQNGMGAHQVADMFRMQHLKRYDELRLQYLHRKALSLNLPHETYQTFLPFEDYSENGFHGFVPGGQWLRDVYDTLIEQHQLILNQHTAMLSGRVCAIDHSHKLAKHVFKVDGVPIFTALLMVTNDKGEICVCVFVATKSHSQFTDALKKMSESLELYGHEQPEVFYTDNMSDKSMLEEIFQSLLADVVAVEKYADLPTFVIEDRVKISVLDSTASIDNAMCAIMDDVPHDGGYIVVGFDSEWNIETGHAGHVTRRGSTAVVQIAYGDNIYVLPIGDMLASGHVPQQLLSLLHDGQVLKAGHLVSDDLWQLETASDLTEAQIQYAACDAHVSLCLFNEINKNPLPVLLSPDNPPSTPLIILNENHKKVVARGCLAMSSTAAIIDSINITSTRAVVEVHEVFVPGFTISQHRKRTLKSFGATPFDIVCHRGHIRTTGVQLGPLHANATTSSTNTNLHNSLQDIECSESHEEEESISLGDLLCQCEHDLDLESGSTDTPVLQQGTAAVDLASTELAESMGARELPVEAFAHIIRSRVLKDAFHLLDMVYISRVHGLHVPFAQAFRDALFIPNSEDKARIEVWLESKGLKWKDMLCYKSRWLWRHCCRTIPPPEVLYPLVHDVLFTWGPLKDAKTGLPLFNTSAWHTAKNILELVCNGYISDPPGVSLYYGIGLDSEADGLPIYRCIRGTNMTEGGVHTHLRSRLPTSGVSIRHMCACLLDFILCHNLLVGTFNSTGNKYTGHDSIWLINEIQELEITLSEHYPGTMLSNSSWVNGNLYQPTSEEMGIMRIPEATCIEACMQPFNHNLDSKQKQGFLAQLLGTSKAVLPLHTASEQKLFSELMKNCSDFTSTTDNVHPKAVQIWNRHAQDKSDIFYKLSEQLTAYFNGNWKSNSNIRLSLSLAFNQTQPVHRRLHDAKCSDGILATSSRPLIPHAVTKGFQEMPDTDTSQYDFCFIYISFT
ncbi:hypothetical protein EDD18DRAFT_1060502 [Armillaria luteobubalina]|uniref:DUF6729 domain-containing protein n=1 Tax=Armillaria luteobubalina TaxID=153913 RepID=A0AA39UVC5_9AGAR|nr:hypothetical protein EDD18DRAFT_1060502 [Armillaria luteobubalina]